MYYINLAMWFVIIVVLSFSYLKERKLFMIAIIVSYICCPYIKIGGVEINGIYILTVLIAILALKEVIQKKAKFKKIHFFFCIAMFSYLLIALIAGAVNGVLDTSTIVSIIGMGNIWVGIICLSLLLQNKDKDNILIHSIFFINCIHTVFGVIQLLSVDLGYLLTSQLFAKADRIQPLLTMKELNAFYRVFGACYSPTILGSYVLIACGYIIACILANKGKNNLYFLLIHTLLLGLFAFSKTVIIGIFVILLIIVLFFAFLQKEIKNNLKQALRMLIAVLLCFIIVTVICYPTRLQMQVNYYFGVIVSTPMQALTSRYGEALKDYKEGTLDKVYQQMQEMEGLSGKTEQEMNGKTEQEMIDSTGATKAVACFFKHPVLGVGITTIGGEFIGDSQYITVLHHSGVLGFVLFALFYGVLFITSITKKNLKKLSILLSIAMCGVAINILEIAVAIPFLAFCIEGQENEKR